MQTLHVIKIGGNIINDEAKMLQFLQRIASIPEKKIIVHGGGRLVDDLALKLGIPQQMIDGRRITDGDTLDLVTMVYAGLINKKIVALLQSLKINALGLSGADNNCIEAQKRISELYDYGFVGDVIEKGVNVSFITDLLNKNITPIFCSITHDNNGQLLNTNADTQASIVAIAMSVNYDIQLSYCFEKKGVLKNIDNEDSVIPLLSENEYQLLRKENIVAKGMIPKLNNAFAAIRAGVKKVVVGEASDILKIISKHEKSGTEIVA
jgi:acetylglutamate kinase